MPLGPIYAPRYENSFALIVGIDRYMTAAPLAHARSDAEGVAEILINTFLFPPDHVTQLYDAEATRDAILHSYAALSATGPEDRVVFFFAGHGHTRQGLRGEVGHLIPHDGDPSAPESLIRWDHFTREAELIPAKHVLFLMDACYGGLALTRSGVQGAGRFVDDMLQRFSRQVLTAGKADEAVADAGGPRPGHSIFTGHLLNALDGDAMGDDGVMSAQSVMSYVYDHVGRDQYSHQTPAFGHIEGDGDLIFKTPKRDQPPEAVVPDPALFYEVQPVAPVDQTAQSRPLPELITSLLSDVTQRIPLDRLVTNELRLALAEIGRSFSVNDDVTADDFSQRLASYWEILGRLRIVTILLSYWATEDHQQSLSKIVARLADPARLDSEKAVWLGLRWHPSMVIAYAGGIAALAADNYQSLNTLINTPITDPMGATFPSIRAVVDGTLEVDRAEMFKNLPGHDRQHTPRSEYLFNALQPDLEDALFLGPSYELLFDRFELLYALSYAHIDTKKRGGEAWGPIGRFGWKLRSEPSPFTTLLEEASRFGNDWAPLKAGMFGGSIDRFLELFRSYQSMLRQHLKW